MDARVARLLTEPEGRAALTAAAEEPDPASLSAATRLRRRFDPELAAAALNQVVLRKQGRAKLPAYADDWLVTPDGLEQATRPSVARWRAERLRAAGVRRVADLGCGIGGDAAAFAEAGLEVYAVDADPATAVVAAANLARYGDAVTVREGRAEDVRLDDDQVVFLDPARRTARGRSWRVEDFSPSWDFVLDRLGRSAGACVKLGPGLPIEMIPDGVLAEWVSDHGDLVEVSLWSDHFGLPGLAATLLPTGDRMVADAGPALTAPPRKYLHEPDPAIIRSGVLDTLAARTGATRLAAGIAYLSTDEPLEGPLWSTFEILESMPYKEKLLKAWVREQGVGVLEIKKRGIDIDPAVLRRRLQPKGSATATLVLTPTTEGARALVVRRLR